MDQRAKHRPRLQQTVERLSIAAVTYYGVGLVGYIAVSLPIDQWGLSLLYIKAGAVPIIALAVWMAIRKVRETVTIGSVRQVIRTDYGGNMACHNDDSTNSLALPVFKS